MEILFFFVGFTFAAVGAYLLFDTYNFRKISQQVAGKILGYEPHISKSRKGSSSTMYTPVVEFIINGATYCFKGSISTNSMPYDIGATVPVLYLEKDPYDARIRSNTRYVLGGILTFVGIILLGVGVATFKTDVISLIIAAVITASTIYKGLKYKAKLNAHGIHTFSDLKAHARNTAGGEISSVSHDLDVAAPRNYRPSHDMITGESVVKNAKVRSRWTAYIFVLVGIGMLAGGVYWAGKRIEFLSIAQITQGQVVALESSTSSEGDTTYRPVVSYIFPPTSQSVTFKHSVSSSHPSFKRGDNVNVLYNPNDKSDAMIDDGWFNWLGPAIVLGVGLLFFLVGVTSCVHQKKQQRRVC